MKISPAFLWAASVLAWIPVSLAPAADFTGDGKDDLAVFRPAGGLWAIRGVIRAYFGSQGDGAVTRQLRNGREPHSINRLTPPPPEPPKGGEGIAIAITVKWTLPEQAQSRIKLR